MNSSLLTVDEPDGFPVDSIVKCIAHPNPGPHVGLFLRITSKPISEEKIDDSPVGVFEASIVPGFYGQDVETLDRKNYAFFALSWMRPATPEEIAAL